MSLTIKDNRFVELTYTITDKKTGATLIQIEYPIGYVHGTNEILDPSILKELDGKLAGDVVEVLIDCNKIYGPRDEGLVYTDKIENVPSEYHEIGTSITMESEKGVARTFVVTRFDDTTLTVDGNNPLCGREVVFALKILSVRNATFEEIQAGGPIPDLPNIGSANTLPI